MFLTMETNWTCNKLRKYDYNSETRNEWNEGFHQQWVLDQAESLGI